MALKTTVTDVHTGELVRTSYIAQDSENQVKTIDILASGMIVERNASGPETELFRAWEALRWHRENPARIADTVADVLEWAKRERLKK